MIAAADAGDWSERNQRHLVACIQQVRALLEGEIARHRGERISSPIVIDVAAGPAPSGKPYALEMLTGAFGLSSFERRVLLLCAAAELDGEVGRLCAALHGDSQLRAPTFALALAALPGASWSALSPDAPLRRCQLVTVLPGPVLTASPLRIEERVLHYLGGVEASEPRLAGVVEPLDGASVLSKSHRTVARQIADAWCNPRGPRALQLCGPGADDKLGIFADAARTLGLRAMRMPAHVLPSSPAEIDLLARLWAREAALGAAALLLDVTDGAPDSPHAIAQFVDQIESPLAIASRERRQGVRRPLVTIDVDKASAREQAETWRQSLGALREPANDAIDGLVAQFSLPSSAIQAMAQRAIEDCAAGGSPAEVLWNLCRMEARPQMDDQAQRIVPNATWDDLVLPDFEKQLLRNIVIHTRARARMHDAWGLSDRNVRGMSITALFAGSSGTGKTMAAEVMAAELKLDLYRIDLSQVVSKYIGETEKNLRRVFDAAEEGGAILLFDEADALFGKRSEVKDSHDRYANIEVSYLLQRMEQYRGLAILTTNLKDSLDAAFVRRIRFSVTFPFPSPQQRAEIWRRAFPRGVPTRNLSYELLARLNIAGGNIRNIAVHAAFLAADANSPIAMSHLLRAARVEFAKMERPLSDVEVRGWV
jgi:AAA+ superfamily predicted ATPase